MKAEKAKQWNWTKWLVPSLFPYESRAANGLTFGVRLIGLYLLLCFALWFFEPTLLFPRWAIPNHKKYQVPSHCVEFKVEDPECGKIHGVMFVPSDHKDYKLSRGTIVYFHGNAETVDTCATWIPSLCLTHNVNVVCFDYPGYGKSTGNPSEKTMLVSGRNSVQWASEFLKIPSEDLVFLGRSIGGGVAVPLAVEANPKGMILERTFDTAISPASNRFWFVPVSWIMNNTFRSIDYAPKYKGPVLQSHGEEDSIIPVRFGKKLYDQFPNQFEFVWMPNVGHNDRSTSLYKTVLERFIDECFPEESSVTD